MPRLSILRPDPARAGGDHAAPSAPPPALEGVADRRRRDHELIATLGSLALRADSLEALMRGACSAAANALDSSHAAVYEQVPGEGILIGHAGHGFEQHALQRVQLGVDDSHAGAALATEAPVVVADWSAERRFAAPQLLSGAQFHAAIAVPILGSTTPYGVLEVQSIAPHVFDVEDVYFLQSVANVLALAIERVRSEERIRHQGLHDALTGLPNRTLFEDRLRQALASACRHRRTVAVLFVDVDNFKRTNDMLGHGGGDEMLREVAKRLDGCIRASDSLARFGGDEFAVLLHEVDGVMTAKSVAQRLLDALGEPIRAGDREIAISASIGIALGGGYDSTGADEIVRNSDLAMYSAKEQGKARVELYAPQMYDAVRHRTEMISDIDKALERDEFVVHYQPIVSLEDGRVADLEALVRWNHPTQGLLSPAQFLPVATETDQIAAISRVVLHKACAQVRRWQTLDPALAELGVSVNLAPAQIKAHDLVLAVKAAVEQAELDPSDLILEVTEHVLVSSDDFVAAQLRSLKRLGARVAVDDFGTGYSALSYLQRFPLDLLKIDKSFIDTLGEREESDLLVEGIVNLAHALNLKTIAEGIETPEQEQRVREMGSELAQGYLFSKPLAPEAMGAYLRSRSAAAGVPAT